MPEVAADIEDGRRLAGGLGRLVYEPPRRLRQFAPVLVAVRIQPEGGSGSPASAHPAASERERHAERTLLAVQLIALDGAAQIVSRAPLIQRSGAGESGPEWHFEITALRSGRIRFELVVTAARQGTSEIDEAARIASAVIARPDWRSRIRRVAALFAAAAFIVLVTWVAARLF